MRLAESPEPCDDTLGGEEGWRPGGRQEVAECLIGWEEALGDEVVDEGAIDEGLVRLTEAEACGIELDRLAVLRTLLNPHPGRSVGSRWQWRTQELELGQSWQKKIKIKVQSNIL